MERRYESTAVLIGRAAGPLASHLGQFVTSLIDQQYTASVISIKVRHALAFDRWLAKHRVVLADLGEVHIARYQHRSRRRHQRIRTETRRRERYQVAQRFCHPSRQGWLAGRTPGELLSDPGGERCNAVHRV